MPHRCRAGQVPQVGGGEQAVLAGHGEDQEDEDGGVQDGEDKDTALTEDGQEGETQVETGK